MGDHFGMKTNRSNMLAIAIPVHNGGDYFARCLETIAGESRVDFHAYIFENASTDGTRAAAEAYAAKDPRFSVRPSERLLPVLENFERAIREVGNSGEYFCIRAADDYTSSNFLEILVGALEKNPAAHIAVPCVTSIKSDGTINKQHHEADSIIENMKTSPIRFPASWYYSVYRSGGAIDALLGSIKDFPHPWGVDRLSIYKIIMDLGAVADNRALFYCQLGSESDILYRAKTMREALSRRFKYYRALKSMRTFSAPSLERSSLFTSQFAWKLAGKHTKTDWKKIRRLPF